MASRPELQAPPEIFYNDEEARKYTSSSRIIEIQVLFLFLISLYIELFSIPTTYFDSNEILFLMKFCWKRRNYQKEHWNCLLCRMMESLSYFLMLVKSKLYFSNTEYRGILLEMCIFLFSINCFNLIQITWPILGTILFFTFKDLEFSACFCLFLLLEHFGVS